MPQYRVKSPGFHGGKLYDPNGRRRVLTTDAPLKKVPSWLEPLKSETASQAKARRAAETKAKKAAAASKDEIRDEVDGASFMADDLDAEKKSNVETLG